jgi:uncharacterized protein YggE
MFCRRGIRSANAFFVFGNCNEWFRGLRCVAMNIRFLLMPAALLTAISLTARPAPVWACGEEMSLDTISVRERVVISTAPDAALIELSLTARGKTMRQAVENTRDRALKLTRALRKQFPDIKHLEFSEPRPHDGLLLSKRERRRQSAQAEATTSIHILMAAQPRKAARLIDFTSQKTRQKRWRRGSDVQADVVFGMLDTTKVDNALRKTALSNAGERARAWAHDAQKEIGTVRAINLACGEAPASATVSPRGRTELRLLYPSPSPGRIELDKTIAVVYELLPAAPKEARKEP